MSNDLKNINVREGASQGAKMKILHPVTGEPMVDDDGTEWFLELLGSDAEEYQNVVHDQQTRRVRKSAARGRVQFSGQELEADGMELIVMATKSWHVIDDGSCPECNPTTVRRIYNEHPWMREQAEAFNADRSNFLGN